MPYIAKDKREKYHSSFMHLLTIFRSLSKEELSGELNYFLSTLFKNLAQPGPSYDKLNSLEGVLDNVAREFHRQQIAPYEDMKENLNGKLEIF